MKNFSLALSLLAAFWLSAQCTASGQTPKVLKNDISVRPFLKIDNTDTQTRIVYNPSDRSFYTIAWNGELFHITPKTTGGYNISRIAGPEDHSINYLQGLALHNSYIFLVGNVVIEQGVSGYGKAVKGEIINGRLAWTEIFRTAEHASSKTLYDHAFSSICFSPDGKDMFIASGSRTDHGEVKDNGGLYPGMREVGLTSCIFKIPADTENLTLLRDSASLAPYVYVRGVRNAFSLAFAPNGDLFSVENSGDRDDPEEMNWIRPGAHYGFPWEMGGNETPMQFTDYNPESDKLLNHDYTGYKIGAFYNDKSFPQKPKNLTYRKPIQNAGPDADKYRDPATGKVMDASDNGQSIGTFTAHRSPLGLVFDMRSEFGGEYAGKGFVLSFQEGSANYGPMEDPGQDLLMLDLKKNTAGDDYTLNAHSIVTNFKEPTDAEIVGNKLYVLEGRGQIWEVTFPKNVITSLPSSPAALFKAYPNPGTERILLECPPNLATINISVLDAKGRLLFKQERKTAHGKTDVDVSSLLNGTYFLKIETEQDLTTTKFLINR